MSQSNIKSWSTTAASNNDGSTGGMPEGQAPNTVNDYVRTQMAAHRVQWEDAEWFNWGHTIAYSSGTEFVATITGTNSDSGTNVYSLGRRVKLYDASSGVAEIRYGTIVSISAAASNQYKVNCTLDAGAITSSISGTAVGIITPSGGAAVSIMPTGAVLPYAGATAPATWLMCYGQSVSISVYPALYSVIGTTYGGAGGVFSIPDIRGRVIAGQDDMGGSSANRLTNQSGGLNGDTLGATGGAETHTLVTAEMPSHLHSQTTAGTGGGASFPTNAGINATTINNTGSTGGDVAHNNVQPTIILNYIIKA